MSLDPRPRLLLFGKTGQVGFDLERALAPLGDVFAIDRAQADLSRPEALRDVIRGLAKERQLACIVNAAAYTAVDRAEQEEALALKINGEAPGVLAEEAKRIGALFVHYSTDYVFDGTKHGAYLETDATGPLNAYGRTKLAGEHAVTAVGGPHLIFRTSWVYGARGANFYLTMRRLLRERPEVRVVADQIGSPTSAGTIADITARVLSLILGPGLDRLMGPGMTLAPEAVSGLYHLAAAGETSWYEYAQEILAQHPPAAGLQMPSLVPIPTGEYPTPARRPMNSRLDCGKLRNTFGVTLPDWKKGLAAVAQEIDPR